MSSCTTDVQPIDSAGLVNIEHKRWSIVDRYKELEPGIIQLSRFFATETGGPRQPNLHTNGPPHPNREQDMGTTILVVDDDRTIRTLMQVALERAGYCVLVAADGEEGLHVFRQHRDRIALLLTDVTMPRMNGFDLADHVLTSDSRIPVVFTSGDVPDADRGYGCIAKPFKLDKLIGRVHEVLKAQESWMNLGCHPETDRQNAGEQRAESGDATRHFRILATATTASQKIAVIIGGPGIEPGGLRREFSSKTEAHYFVEAMNLGWRGQ